MTVHFRCGAGSADFRTLPPNLFYRLTEHAKLKKSEQEKVADCLIKVYIFSDSVAVQ